LSIVGGDIAKRLFDHLTGILHRKNFDVYDYRYGELGQGGSLKRPRLWDDVHQKGNSKCVSRGTSGGRRGEAERGPKI